MQAKLQTKNRTEFLDPLIDFLENNEVSVARTRIDVAYHLDIESHTHASTMTSHSINYESMTQNAMKRGIPDMIGMEFSCRT